MRINEDEPPQPSGWLSWMIYRLLMDHDLWLHSRYNIDVQKHAHTHTRTYTKNGIYIYIYYIIYMHIYIYMYVYVCMHVEPGRLSASQ